jgi:hypothetical protein
VSPKDIAKTGIHDAVIEKMTSLYLDLFKHDGFGQMRVEMRFLKKGQKEVIINCGKEYRFVLDYGKKELEKVS